ncbi:sulfite exporter TauE/SafE family protein [Corynebacterium epidermidicanis]|uniref:Probable membrane transporter protein n=1 Tax=Corynebacterium epidermidicanis TaxID=1050174 RepID=A0A0G3GTW3_9CORY|nr:sulfite exporter TauE/SafE family protein [Corynebacterium epidermidicanis]AKK02988.1 putative permease [Corynebacterium epidermidicanis]
MNTLILVFCVVVLGSSLQRVAGMGLGLIAGPILSLFMGPVHGVMVVNILAMINAALTTVTVRKDVDWRRFALIGSVMVLGSIPGAYLIKSMSTAWMLVAVGTVLLAALSVVTLAKRYVPATQATWPMMLSGVIGGFTNTLAGVAGPVITVYAQAARWEHKRFAATLQPLFVVSGGVSFAVKSLTGAADLSGTTWLIWPVGIAGMFLGVFLGGKLAQVITRDKAHKLALGLALAGGFSALLRGLLSL